MVRELALSIRVTPDIKEAVTRAAEADGRTVSTWVARLIEAHLKEAQEASGGPEERGRSKRA